jgi:tRNA threonylcarbamoyladenosine biosynthesis protein TsaE
MSVLSFVSFSPKQTQKLANLLLKKTGSSQPLVFALSGPLGSGKTCFVQGMAKALGVKENIISPSFIIMRPFLVADNKKIKKRFFWHIDCWRLGKKDLSYLGLREILSNSENIVCIEWADKVKSLLPQTVFLTFSYLDKNSRKIIIKNK